MTLSAASGFRAAVPSAPANQIDYGNFAGKTVRRIALARHRRLPRLTEREVAEEIQEASRGVVAGRDCGL